MNGKTTRTANSTARLLAVQALFEIEATRRPYAEVTAEVLSRDANSFLDAAGDDAIEINQKLMRQIVKDAVYDQVKIDQTVSKVLAENWPIKSVDPTLRAIFRAAAAEFLAGKAPFKVVINEYLDITRAFDDRKDTISFVNAVIDNTRKALSPES